MSAALHALELGWVDPPGFCKPNTTTYPWQWLWDSCFHAVIWSGLGDERAVTELRALFSLQLENGFIPHMGYVLEPKASRHIWRHDGRSDITQPPMYGHALRVLRQRRFDISELIEPAQRGLGFVLRTRLDPKAGVIRIFHPWESGCDDSNRWDSWVDPSSVFERGRWRERKQEFVTSLVLSQGVAVANPEFDVGSVGFTALVAFNCLELAAVSGDSGLERQGDELRMALERRWSPALSTWIDVDAQSGEARASSGVRTLDALLPLLVVRDPQQVEAGFAALFDRGQFWTHYGPAGTAIDEPSFRADEYWRGPAWPQLTYLLMLAADRHGRMRDALRLAAALERGAMRSGHAEYWNPFTGEGLGAIPQGWTGLAHEATLLRGRLSDHLKLVNTFSHPLTPR